MDCRAAYFEPTNNVLEVIGTETIFWQLGPRTLSV